MQSLLYQSGFHHSIDSRLNESHQRVLDIDNLRRDP